MFFFENQIKINLEIKNHNSFQNQIDFSFDFESNLKIKIKMKINLQINFKVDFIFFQNRLILAFQL